MTGVRQKPAPRMTTASAERAWYLADIENVKAERKKFGVETRQLEEQVKSDAYDRMLRESGPRGRREYDFTDEVSAESSADLVATLSEWLHESERGVLVRLNTPGGDEVAGLAIIDFIRVMNSAGWTIDTLALGQASSMGSVLLQAGATRYVAEHSVLLIHESRTFGEDAPVMEKLSDMKARMRLGEMLERSCNDLLAARSTFVDTDALVEHYGSEDWWLTAGESLFFGFADAIWT